MLRIVERPVMLESFLEGLVVVGRRAGDARAGRTLVEHRRQRRRVIHLLGQWGGLQKGRHAEVAVVVGVLDAAERVASRHRGCDEGRAQFR